MSLRRKHVSPKAQRLRGLAALTEILEMIGEEDVSDQHVAKVIVDNDRELKALVEWATASIGTG